MPFDDLKPSIRIEVEGNEVTKGVTDQVIKCEVELSRDMADQITLTVANPIEDLLGGGYQAGLLLTDSKLFQPGNEISVFMGYGDDPAFIARGVITKFLPVFPSDGMPTLTIKALDASAHMMDGEGATDPATYDNYSMDTIVLEILNKYGIVPNEVEPVIGAEPLKLIKKRGMSDYTFVKGLANIKGFEFKVYYDNDAGTWKANWRTPKSDQAKQYTFTYLNSPQSTLLSFEPSFGLRDSPTTVQVLYFDRDTRAWEDLKVEETEAGEDPKSGGSPDELMEEEIKSSTKLRIAAAGQSVEVITERPFKSAEEALNFAERWMRARKNHFLMGRGRIPGLEVLRAGDIHVLSNLGTQLSGEWEFTSVKHTFSDRGFETEFFGNKVLD